MTVLRLFEVEAGEDIYQRGNVFGECMNRTLSASRSCSASWTHGG